MKGSDRIADELRALKNAPDSKIDTSDIPERSNWTGATRGRFRATNIAEKRAVYAPLTQQQKLEIRKLLSEGASTVEIA